MEKYFWVHDVANDEVTVAQYAGEGVWRFFREDETGHSMVNVDILDEIKQPPHAAQRRSRRASVHKTATGIIHMSDKPLKVGDTTTATVSFKDKDGGNLTLPKGHIPAWSVDQVALASLEPAKDGMSAKVTALAAGLVTVICTAEANEEAGVDTVTAMGSLTVADDANSGEITFKGK